MSISGAQNPSFMGFGPIFAKLKDPLKGRELEEKIIEWFKEQDENRSLEFNIDRIFKIEDPYIILLLGLREGEKYIMSPTQTINRETFNSLRSVRVLIGSKILLDSYVLSPEDEKKKLREFIISSEDLYKIAIETVCRGYVNNGGLLGEDTGFHIPTTPEIFIHTIMRMDFYKELAKN